MKLQDAELDPNFPIRRRDGMLAFESTYGLGAFLEVEARNIIKI